jgi:heat shock protein HtpX
MDSNLYKIQESNVLKTWTLMLGFLIFIILLGWFFSLYFESPVILYFFIMLSLIMNFVSYWFSDRIVLRISGAKKASREEYFDLYNITENLSISTGLPMPKLYVINESAPNAFATGRNQKHSAVAVTTGLLQILDKSELEGVIAHELAHIKNKDILLQSVVVVLVGLITLLADFFVRSMFFGGGNRDNKLAPVFLIVGILLMILSPIVATIIQLAISRKREFLADSTGALMTRYPDGLASALAKISSSDITMRKANHATAHMYISDPFNDKKEKRKTSFMHKLFMTHPPVEERIEALLGKK